MFIEKIKKRLDKQRIIKYYNGKIIPIGYPQIDLHCTFEGKNYIYGDAALYHSDVGFPVC